MTATEQATIHNTFVLERHFPQRPARLFSAFSQPALKRRWYAEGDHDILDFHMDFRLGGDEKYRYRFREGPVAVARNQFHRRYQKARDALGPEGRRCYISPRGEL